MRRGIATISLSGTLASKLEAISAAGFDGVEIFEADLVASSLRPAEVAARCADLGLTIDLYQPIRDVEGVDPRRSDEVLRRVARKLDVARDLGTTRVLVCSNALAEAEADRDLSAEQLHSIGALADERGISVAFEALAWGRHVNRVPHAWDIVSRADHPSIGLAVDTFHLLASGDQADVLSTIPGERIFFLQIADAPLLEMGLLGWSRHYRCFPGQGMLDVVGVVDCVLRAGYAGPLSLEVFSDVVRCADPQATALEAMRSLYGLEEEIRCRWSNSKTDSPNSVRLVTDEDHRLFVASQAPTSVDFAFVELAVSEKDPFVGTLEALGFSRAGVHRTKPAEWWRNGGVDLVLNYDPKAGVPGPVATGVGLIVDDAAGIASRADQLLWPRVDPVRGVGEALLPGFRTPGGLQVFFSGPSGTSDDWLRDFDRVGAEATHGLLRIDHIGLQTRSEKLEEETSFFRAVLGLRASPLIEFAEPYGRLLSRVVSARAGDARIVLNVEDRLAVNPYPRPGPNQLAFGTDDLLGELPCIREAGIAFLPIPENYYDDLECRFELDSGFVARLRANDVLYDSTDGGEFLHAYATHLAHAFYVEFVQRIGDYDGFGVPNTHVRLALQAEQQED